MKPKLLPLRDCDIEILGNRIIAGLWEHPKDTIHWKIFESDELLKILHNHFKKGEG